MNNLIPQPKLIELLCGATKTDRAVVEKFIDVFTAVVSESLAAGDSVKIKGFGQFRLVKDNGTTKVAFQPEKEISDAINAPFACFEPVELAPGLTAEYLDEYVKEDLRKETPDEAQRQGTQPMSQPKDPAAEQPATIQLSGEEPAEEEPAITPPHDEEHHTETVFTEVIFEEEEEKVEEEVESSQTEPSEPKLYWEVESVENDPLSAGQPVEEEKETPEEHLAEEESPEEHPIERDKQSEGESTHEEEPMERVFSLEDLPSDKEPSDEVKSYEKEISFDDVPPVEGEPAIEETQKTDIIEDLPKIEDAGNTEYDNPTEDKTSGEETKQENVLPPIEPQSADSPMTKEEASEEETSEEEEEELGSASLEVIYQRIMAELNAMAQQGVSDKPETADDQHQEEAPAIEPEKGVSPEGKQAAADEEPTILVQPPVVEEPATVSPTPLEEEPFTVPSSPVVEEPFTVPSPPVVDEPITVPPPVEEEAATVLDPLLEEETATAPQPKEDEEHRTMTDTKPQASIADNPISYPETKQPQPKPWFWIAISYVAGMAIGFALGFFGHDYVSGATAKSDIPDIAPNDSATAAETVAAPEIDLSDAEEGVIEAPESEESASPEEPAIEEPTEEEDEPQNEEPAAPQPAEPVYDTVTTGRFLSTMAKEHYGNKVYWVYIYLENQDKIKNPNNVQKGTRLLIPPKEKYDVSATDEAANLRAANAKQAEIYKKFGTK